MQEKRIELMQEYGTSLRKSGSIPTLSKEWAKSIRNTWSHPNHQHMDIPGLKHRSILRKRLIFEDNACKLTQDDARDLSCQRSWHKRLLAQQPHMAIVHDYVPAYIQYNPIYAPFTRQHSWPKYDLLCVLTLATKFLLNYPVMAALKDNTITIKYMCTTIAFWHNEAAHLPDPTCQMLIKILATLIVCLMAFNSESTPQINLAFVMESGHFFFSLVRNPA
ncbi:hypothetical protein KP509_28G006000 [Ceratopteris richardii]|uniref:Uncharacterized protein n=1 Tax=Ceratopteris richardii TaxID=49495 RepID=A0A8T2R984_CERRI|nr:hypothetical protein KP509_28G006000 [Ceratopteris richardii]